jgi:putative phage-type endonuclease
MLPCEWIATASEEEWLAARQCGVTASECAAVLGVSRWSTPLHVYLDKVEPPRVVPFNELSMRLRWGLRLEDDLTDEYETVFGIKPGHYPHRLARSTVYPWLLATPDRFLMDEEGRQVPLELKTAEDGEQWGREETDDVPLEYAVQVMQQCVVLGAPYGRLAVVIKKDDFRRYTIVPNEATRKLIVEGTRAFWDLVTQGQAPEADFGHPATLALLGRMYGVEEAERVELGGEAFELAKEYVSLGRRESELKRQRNEIKARLLAEMGQAGTGHLPGGWTLKRKTVHRAGFVTKPTSFPRLTVRMPGGWEETEE